MTDDRAIAKIKKLLALASDPSAAPNEAETAQRQAHALMAKLDLDLADLEQAELEAEWDMTELEMPGARPGKRNPREVPTWIGIIAFGAAVYTRTRVSKAGGYIRFKGPRQDCELAQWMTRALIDLAYSRAKTSEDPAAFRNGFASAVQARLKAMAADRDRASQEAGANALIVLDKREAKMDELYGKASGGRRSNARSSADGYAAGESAHLPTNRPVTQNGSWKALPAA